MKQRWDLIAGAGVGLALLVFLIGDNIIGRAFFDNPPPSSPKRPVEIPADPPIESNSVLEPPPVAHNPLGLPRLIGVICTARTLTISFDARPSDPLRYRRRAGATIVPVSLCNEETREFRTGDGLTTSGRVAGDRVEFEYIYLDGEGAPRCNVRARQTGRNRLEGTIYCEATGASMESRRTVVEID